MSLDFLPQINQALCTLCEKCVVVCPHQALQLVKDRITIEAPSACDYCGVCQCVCPTGAISLVFEIVLSE